MRTVAVYSPTDPSIELTSSTSRIRGMTRNRTPIGVNRITSRVIFMAASDKHVKRFTIGLPVSPMEAHTTPNKIEKLTNPRMLVPTSILLESLVVVVPLESVISSTTVL